MPTYLAAAVIHVDQHKCDGLVGPHALRLLVGDRLENGAGEAPLNGIRADEPISSLWNYVIHPQEVTYLMSLFANSVRTCSERLPL